MSANPAKATAASGQTSPGRQRAYAVLACLAGGGLVLFATGRVWAVEVTARAPLSPLRTDRPGGALIGWLPPLAVVAIAAAGALLATRGRGRALVGVMLVAIGVAIVAAGGYGVTLADSPGWPLVTALGGLLVAASGAFALARGRHWPAMGTRYDRSDTNRSGYWPTTSQDVWDALDRGEDPTVSDRGGRAEQSAPRAEDSGDGWTARSPDRQDQPASNDD
jgi:MFS family permease